MIHKKNRAAVDAFAKRELTRRRFLSIGAGALAGAALAGPLWSLAGCSAPPPLTDRSVPRVLADMHVHSMINKWNRRTPIGIRYPGIATLAETTFNRSGMKWKDCYEAGVDLICATHFNVFDEWLSMPTDPDPEAPTKTYRMLDQLERELLVDAAPFARLATNPDDLSLWLDIPKQNRDWRVVVVHTVEGGHAWADTFLQQRYCNLGELISVFSRRWSSLAGARSFRLWPRCHQRGGAPGDNHRCRPCYKHSLEGDIRSYDSSCGSFARRDPNAG